jgi:hypothetical protein
MFEFMRGQCLYTAHELERCITYSYGLYSVKSLEDFGLSNLFLMAVKTFPFALDNPVWLGVVHEGKVEFGSDRQAETPKLLVVKLFVVVDGDL